MLPTSRPEKSDRPLVPITIRSQPNERAASMMVGATEPARADTACPDTSTPSASRCLIAWSTTPWASVFVSTGRTKPASWTCNTWTVPPNFVAISEAAAVAWREGSEPSTAKRIFSNISSSFPRPGTEWRPTGAADLCISPEGETRGGEGPEIAGTDVRWLAPGASHDRMPRNLRGRRPPHGRQQRVGVRVAPQLQDARVVSGDRPSTERDDGVLGLEVEVEQLLGRRSRIGGGAVLMHVHHDDAPARGQRTPADPRSDARVIGRRGPGAQHDLEAVPLERRGEAFPLHGIGLDEEHVPQVSVHGASSFRVSSRKLPRRPTRAEGRRARPRRAVRPAHHEALGVDSVASSGRNTAIVRRNATPFSSSATPITIENSAIR